MGHSRRSFFKAFGTFSILTGVGGIFSSNALAKDEANVPAKTEVPSLNPPGFSLKVTTKFFFPKNKPRLQVGEDRKKWMVNYKKMKRFTHEMERDGLLSTITQYLTFADHHELVMYFKDMEAFQRYNQFTIENKVINLELQKKLGYTVISEFTNIA